GRALRFRAEVSETDSRSAHASAPEQVDDRQQDDRADQGRDESHDVEAATGAGRATDQRRDQPAADQGADDADDDVEQDALLRVRLHDHAGKRADDADHYQVNDGTHHDSSLLCPWCFGEKRFPCAGQEGVSLGWRDGDVSGPGPAWPRCFTLAPCRFRLPNPPSSARAGSGFRGSQAGPRSRWPESGWRRSWIANLA